MFQLTRLTIVQAPPDEGLTFREIIDSLPADPASLFGILLLAAFFGAVLYFGTRSGRGGGPAAPRP